MIWIVSSSIAGTEENLSARHEYIEMVSQARVSPWQKRTVMIADKRYLNYYQCKSEKGEYGLFVSAHTPEVAIILSATLSWKRAICAINSCQISDMHKLNLLRTIKQYNQQSELYLAQQEKDQRNGSFNYAEDFGTFGFLTTKSEREVFMHRKEGLTRAIRLAFEKIPAT